MKLSIWILVFVTISPIMNAQTFMTTEGEVRAYEVNGVIKAYNIPYAAPPIGDLRWKAPAPPLKHSGIWDGKNSNTTSAQVRGAVMYAPEKFGDITGSEDCLYLDITTHENHNHPRPVIVWIHGGANQYGSKSDEIYDTDILAKNTGAVIVKVNYRLGILGSFYYPEMHPDDPLSASGNYTLLDLVQALHWVHANIESFGGDSSNITLMGESAGCVNIWSLMLSPLSEGLFSKVICSSGFPLIVSAHKAKKQAHHTLCQLLVRKGVAKNLKEANKYLKTASISQVKDFLYGLDIEDITKATAHISHRTINDGYTLHSQKLFAVKRRLANTVPMLTGTTLNEASYFLMGKYSGLSSKEMWDAINRGENIEKVVHFTHSEKYPKYWKKVESITKMLVWLANHHYKRYARFGSPVYKYKFEALPEVSPWKEVFGATHASDLVYLFGKESFSHENYIKFMAPHNLAYFHKQVEQLHLYIKNFINQGNPGKVNGLRWTTWGKRHKALLHIRNNGFYLTE